MELLITVIEAGLDYNSYLARMAKRIEVVRTEENAAYLVCQKSW